MKVSDVSTSPRKRVYDSKRLKIQAWDVANDYPHKLADAINESGSALSCVEVYATFIRGAGFPTLISDAIVNRKGQTLNDLLALVAIDRATYGGLAIHVNYNEFLEIAEYNYIPFEHTRLGLPNKENAVEVTHIAVNSDWMGVREVASVKNTEYIDVFNPRKEVVLAQMEAAGGVSTYKGQILWWSNQYGYNYPLPTIDAVITDVNTEGGVATTKNRNVKNNFFPAGVLVVEGEQADSPDNTKDERDLNEESNLVTQMKKMQGDRNACNVAVIEIDRGTTQKPEFLKFSGENYDAAFKNTEESVQKNIGRRFKQPPVLRCEDVASGFADDTMQQAYNFYNSVTQDERGEIERIFNKLIGAYTNYVDLSALKITPKSYGYAVNQ